MEPTYGIYLADLQRARTDSLGIVNYAVGLTRALPASLRADETLVVYVSSDLVEEVRADFSDDRVQYRVTPPVRHAPRRLWLDHVWAPRSARRDGVSVLHFPKGFIPALHGSEPGVVATLHDDMTLRRSATQGFWSGAKRRYFAWATRHTLRQADALLTVSNSSRNALLRAADRQGNADLRVDVTGQAMALPCRGFVPLAQRAPRVLHFGSPSPHKRSADAIRFTTDFIAAEAPALDMVVTGRLDEATEALAAERGVKRVRQVLPNDDLAALVASSRALIFTSEYEGFGLPPVEALALGTPVTYCAAPAMEEVLRGMPGRHGVGDADGFAAALRAVLSIDESGLRSLQRTMADRWSWTAVAERTLGTYRRVHAERAPMQVLMSSVPS